MRTQSYFAMVLAVAVALSSAAPSSASTSAKALSGPSSSSTSARAASTSRIPISAASTSRNSTASVTTTFEKVTATSIDLKFVRNSKAANRTLANPKLRVAVQTSTSSIARSKLPISSAATSTTKKAVSTAAKTTSTAAARTTTTSSATPEPTQSGADIPDFYVGANSYYLYALPKNDRVAVLDAMANSGMKMVRIFIAHIYYNNKGSGNKEIPDLEQWGVGQYDDTILKLIDQLMVEVQERGMKLIIACGDRYALGYWDTDQYAYQYGIVGGGSGAQRIADATTFYTSNDAQYNYDMRIEHILKHKNTLMGNKPWSQLDSVVYAFEPQNEPMGHMGLVSTSWNCDRAGRIKQNLPSNSNIKITTGGGTTTSLSLEDWAFECDNFDIVSVHDYGTSAGTTVAALVSAQGKAAHYGKTILFEEWGAMGWNKANTIKAFAEGLAQAGIPWLYWEIVKPGKGSSDFEVWTDEESWGVLGDGWSTGTWWKKRDLQERKQSPSSPQVGVPAAKTAVQSASNAENRFSRVKRHRQHQQQPVGQHMAGRRIVRSGTY